MRNKENNSHSARWFIFVLLALFLLAGFIGFNFIQNNHIGEKEEYSLYIGKEDGKILKMSKDGEFEELYEFNDTIHQIKFEDGRPYFSVGSKGADSGVRVVDDNIESYSFEGYTHGISIVGDKLYATNHAPSQAHEVNKNAKTDDIGDDQNEENHDHSDQENGDSHEHSESHHKSGGGNVIVFDLQSKERIKTIEAGSPHRIVRGEDYLYVMDALGSIHLIGQNSMEIERTLEIGEYLGDIRWKDNNLIVSYKRMVEEDLPEGFPESQTKKGFIGVYNQSGTLKNEVLIGKGTLPHDVSSSNGEILMADYLSGDLYFVKNGEIQEILDIGESPISLTVKGDLAFVADKETETIHQINTSTRNIIQSKEVKGVHSLRIGPSNLDKRFN
jgi:hypothetical protein